MKITNHCYKRFKQRGFSKLILDIIYQYGKCSKAPGNATKIYLGNKQCREAERECKRLLQHLDKAKGGTLIIKNDSILTAYKN
jgi:hypothetical protein